MTDPGPLHVDLTGRDIGCNLRCLPDERIHTLLLYRTPGTPPLPLGEKLPTLHGPATVLAYQPNPPEAPRNPHHPDDTPVLVTLLYDTNPYTPPSPP